MINPLVYFLLENKLYFEWAFSSTPKAHAFVSLPLESNFGTLIFRIFTWKNLIRGISTGICAILIRKGIYYFFNVDMLIYFLSNVNDLCTNILAFWYFFFNFFVGLTMGEIFNQLLVNWVKESTKKFLGIPLGIEWPNNKLPLIGPSKNEFTSNIKEVPIKETSVTFSTRESPLSSRSHSPTSNRSLSPFSRPATPPAFGPREFDPALNNHNLPNTPLTASTIRPEYFSTHNDNTDVFWALDTTITRIIRNLYGDILRPGRVNGVVCPPFGWDSRFDRLVRDNPFHMWSNIRSTNECSELELRCIISRLEFAKSDLINRGDQDTILNRLEGRVRIMSVYDRLLDEANRSLRSRFPASSSRNTNS